MQSTYTFVEALPDMIHASLILSIELIFSEESLFLLILNAGMKEGQK